MVGVPRIVVALNKVDAVTTRSFWTWWSWRCGSLLKSYQFPGTTYR